jgi:hypothetical protein
VASLAFAPRSAHADCASIKAGKFKVKIDSAPQGAAIYINDKSCSIGATPWEGALANGEFTVLLEAQGYEPTQRKFTVARVRKTQELFVPMAKKPQLEINANADPQLIGATVSLDGQPSGLIQGPLVINTTAARHLVEIKKDGFETLSQWIDLTTAPQLTLTPTLKAAAKWGSVIVEADVPDAEIYIDGNKHPDTAPTVINKVVEGIHVIEVKKAPSPPWKMTVTVTAGQPTKVRAELQAGMGGGVGVVRVLSDAAGARAFLDGVDMGPVPVDIKDIKAGDHIVQVKAPGFQAGERHVQITAGGSKIEKFDLNPEAMGESGMLKVVTTVPEAQVFIDNELLPKGNEKKVSAGDHSVVVRRDGYKEFQKTVHVDAGKSTTVPADLKAVGRLRLVSTPSGATVSINGLPVGKAPMDYEVEVGENVVKIELGGFQAWEQKVNVAGGKTETLLAELVVAGKSEQQLMSEQRGLSSFGARALPRGRSTVDLGAGYPYFFTGRVNVGAGSINDQFAFDAGVGVRTMFAQSELGLGGRLTLFDQEPFSTGVFTDVWWGSQLFDDSKRNGVTWDLGALVSLTAVGQVTITGRLYVEMWSDRHCPDKGNMADGFDGDALAICKQFKDGTLDAAEMQRVKDLTGWKTGTDVFTRENGARLVASIVAELALQQQVNLYGILEGGPFGGFHEERALFTKDFSHSMILDTDHNLYLRVGLSYKF